ncbi:hypothetical protein DL93DRAFT_2078590 [Clavulina sp. PMI_390]|nr:hypothetical protein DL93DRAFT_2078590 [Clavulina sp. PMI_390]
MSAMSFGPQTYAAGAATSTSPIDINSDASSSSSRSGRKQVLRVSIPSSTFSIPFDEIGVSPPNDTTTPLSQPITGLNSTGVVPSAIANSHPSSVANTSSSSASASAGRNPTSTTVVPSPSSASFRSTGLAPIRPHSRSSLHKSKSSLEHRPSLSLRGNDARRLEGGITKNRSMTNTSSPRRPSFLSPGLPDALLLST